MAHICIVTGAHLCRNPRVVKEAAALREAGHRVTVLGPATDARLSELDASLVRDGGFEHRVVVDLRPGSPERTRHRLVRRLATEAGARLGWERPEALGYGMRAMLRAARELAADLTIGHQEVGTWVVSELMDAGFAVGADIEDWYSEDLLPEARVGRPVGLLRRCEARLVRRGRHVTTTSEALAAALAEAYDGPTPGVIYNAFPWAERADLDGELRDRVDAERPSLHWVSQTVGPGRGLETLCAALGRVERPIDVHLRGRADEPDRRWLAGLFPDERGHRLHVHGLVPPQELLGRIAEHDIGLALEDYDPPSRNLTVTNKILHYLVAGLAVVATDTAGQREVAAHAPDAVRLCEGNDAVSLAAQIEALVQRPGDLQRAKAAALAAARERFSWEAQRPILIRSVEAALGAQTPHWV
jgi:glycosyltransferase involved in cell wall biosynthesis